MTSLRQGRTWNMDKDARSVSGKESGSWVRLENQTRGQITKISSLKMVLMLQGRC